MVAKVARISGERLKIGMEGRFICGAGRQLEKTSWKKKMQFGACHSSDTDPRASIVGVGRLW